MEIKEEDLNVLCIAFHKWFRTADCKHCADMDMYLALNKLSSKDYSRAMKDSLSEIDIKVIKDES